MILRLQNCERRGRVIHRGIGRPRMLSPIIQGYVFPTLKEAPLSYQASLILRYYYTHLK